jgi:hypothetical protein
MPLTNSFNNWLKRSPIQDSPFVKHNETGESILPPPPTSEFVITQNSYQVITQDGNSVITN